MGSPIQNTVKACHEVQLRQKESCIDAQASRRETLIKLRELKRMSERSQVVPAISFYVALTDSGYREEILLRFSYVADSAIARLAQEILDLNYKGDLLCSEPNLGDEVFVRVYPAQSDPTILKKPSTKFRRGLAGLASSANGNKNS